MDDRQLVRLSKRLSLVLRHRPDRIGIQLDPQGWVGVPDLLAAFGRRGVRLTREQLLEVVARNDKQRFALEEDRDRIRAQQGHSVPVDLALSPRVPPAELFHGTLVGSVRSILAHGLDRGGRHDVHLSADRATAAAVGGRRGRPAVLTVDAGRMHADGYEFRRSGNGVWLTAEVPAGYLRVAGEPAGPSLP